MLRLLLWSPSLRLLPCPLLRQKSCCASAVEGIAIRAPPATATAAAPAKNIRRLTSGLSPACDGAVSNIEPSQRYI